MEGKERFGPANLGTRSRVSASTGRPRDANGAALSPLGSDLIIQGPKSQPLLSPSRTHECPPNLGHLQGGERGSRVRE